jgi:hypothetical protein
MYPEASVVYTDTNGTTYDVPCYVPGKAKEVSDADCPAPFVHPHADDHAEICILPCPVPAYTDDEYTLMWMISNLIELFGFCLNLFMLCTWMLEKSLWKQPYQLKFCVGAGIVYGAPPTDKKVPQKNASFQFQHSPFPNFFSGFVGTLPSLALKYKLACACETEEW